MRPIFQFAKIVHVFFFKLLWTKKSKSCGYNHAKCLFMCYFSGKAPKKSPFLVVLTWFPILGKIKDGDHCRSRHRSPAAPPPIKYTSSCKEDQRLSTKGKIVWKYCNISKTPGRCSIPPPPTAPYHGGGMSLFLRPRVKKKGIWIKEIVK